MVCLFCDSQTQVTNSRHNTKTNKTWRRRRCHACRAIFTSYEAFDLAEAIRVVSDNKLSPFSRDELFISLYESCRHRPTAAQDATELTNTVIAHLPKKVASEGLLERQMVINTALMVLKRFDTTAATYYKAYYANK